MCNYSYCVFKGNKFFDAVFASKFVCPGDILIYECTVMGGHATIWKGSTFDCPCKDLVLLHSHFYYYGTRNYYCNNRTIEAKIISPEGNNYTSQLNVTVTPDIAGTIITCAKDAGYMDEIQLTLEIPIIAGLPPFH